MKAIVYTQYGAPSDVLQFRGRKTKLPSDDEVLIKVHAASINAADWHLLRVIRSCSASMSGLLRQKTPSSGSDIAGRVEAVGRNVQEFLPGDAVFGDLSGCGLGGFAEYVSVPEHAVITETGEYDIRGSSGRCRWPRVTALQALRDKGQIQPGHNVLIHGASGGVGTFAVQIAKSFRAEVTAVCSTRKVDLVRSLGADHVIDYTRRFHQTLGSGMT